MLLSLASGIPLSMFKMLILLGLLLGLAPAGAAQIKLDSLRVGSQIFSNVTVIGANTTDLYFSHSKGFANVKLKYLDPELQKRFDYDPKAAEKLEQQQTKEDTSYSIRAVATAAASRPATSATVSNAPNSNENTLADPVSDASPLGKPGPTLLVEKWLGETPSLDRKFILISFWAPWSVPCRKAIPQLNALQKKFAPKLQIVGLTASPEADVQAMTDAKIEFASAIDTKKQLQSGLGITTIPYVLLMDPKGTVLYQGHPAALNERQLDGIISASAP